MSIKEWFSRQQTLAKDSLTRFKNNDFLEAVVAGCALIAAADGKISPEEKETMVGFIQRNDALKVFDMAKVIETFNKFASNFEFNFSIGKAEALRAVSKLNSNDEAARMLVRVCCAVGMADGDFDDKEKAATREICSELKLNPTEFGL